MQYSLNDGGRACHMLHSLNGGGGPLTYSIHSMVEGGTLTCVTGSNFNKYPAACKSAELIDWTHKQLKRITFVKQQVYSVCEPRKISYINKLTKDNISVSIKATQYEPTK